MKGIERPFYILKAELLGVCRHRRGHLKTHLQQSQKSLLGHNYKCLSFLCLKLLKGAQFGVHTQQNLVHFFMYFINLSLLSFHLFQIRASGLFDPTEIVNLWQRKFLNSDADWKIYFRYHFL